MLEIIYLILSKKEAYRDPGVDYEKLTVDRNAPRWIKALEKYGYLPGKSDDSQYLRKAA
jgi:transposase